MGLNMLPRARPPRWQCHRRVSFHGKSSGRHVSSLRRPEKGGLRNTQAALRGSLTGPGPREAHVQYTGWWLPQLEALYRSPTASKNGECMHQRFQRSLLRRCCHRSVVTASRDSRHGQAMASSKIQIACGMLTRPMPLVAGME